MPFMLIIASSTQQTVRRQTIPKSQMRLVTCYKIGIGNGSAACVNDLGALYCMGDIVAQPAIRIANIIMKDDCESYGVERDSPRHC